MAKYTREPINGFTHLFGAILSFAGLLILVIKTTLESCYHLWYIFNLAVFSISYISSSNS